MTIFKRILMFLGAIVLMLFVVGFVIGAVGAYKTSPAPAETNTAQNAHRSYNRQQFVDGCSAESVTKQFCNCAYDKMAGLYGSDWGDNTVLLTRITQSGYTQEETDAMTPCANTSPAI